MIKKRHFQEMLSQFKSLSAEHWIGGHLVWGSSLSVCLLLLIHSDSLKIKSEGFYLFVRLKTSDIKHNNFTQNLSLILIKSILNW